MTPIISVFRGVHGAGGRKEPCPRFSGVFEPNVDGQGAQGQTTAFGKNRGGCIRRRSRCRGQRSETEVEALSVWEVKEKGQEVSLKKEGEEGGRR